MSNPNPRTASAVNAPRHASTYRGARRNMMRRMSIPWGSVRYPSSTPSDLKFGMLSKRGQYGRRVTVVEETETHTLEFHATKGYRSYKRPTVAPILLV